MIKILKKSEKVDYSCHAFYLNFLNLMTAWSYKYKCAQEDMDEGTGDRPA